MERNHLKVLNCISMLSFKMQSSLSVLTFNWHEIHLRLTKHRESLNVQIYIQIPVRVSQKMYVAWIDSFRFRWYDSKYKIQCRGTHQFLKHHDTVLQSCNRNTLLLSNRPMYNMCLGSVGQLLDQSSRCYSHLHRQFDLSVSLYLYFVHRSVLTVRPWSQFNFLLFHDVYDLTLAFLFGRRQNSF